MSQLTQSHLDYLIVQQRIGILGRQFHTDIVLRESVHRLASRRLLKQHICLLTDMLLIEGDGLLIA